MTIQFNYFAMDDDLATVADIAFDCIPNLMVFPQKGTWSEMRGRSVSDSKELIPESPAEFHLLVPANRVGDLVQEPCDDGKRWIDLRNSPAVEYSPSVKVSDAIVKIGRFVLFFDSDLEMRKRFKKFVSRLRQASAKLSNCDLYVFPNARANAEFLRPWGGKDWPNRWRQGDKSIIKD